MAAAEPEQVFFDDPALDRAVAMIMALAAELSVAKDRAAILEHLLIENGYLDRDAIDDFAPPPELEQKMRTEREAFIQGLMEPLLGLANSKSAPTESVL